MERGGVAGGLTIQTEEHRPGHAVAAEMIVLPGCQQPSVSQDDGTTRSRRRAKAASIKTSERNAGRGIGGNMAGGRCQIGNVQVARSGTARQPERLSAETHRVQRPSIVERAVGGEMHDPVVDGKEIIVRFHHKQTRVDSH